MLTFLLAAAPTLAFIIIAIFIISDVFGNKGPQKNSKTYTPSEFRRLKSKENIKDIRKRRRQLRMNDIKDTLEPIFNVLYRIILILGAALLIIYFI